MHSPGSTEQELKQALGDTRVLIADDSQAIRSYLRALLEEFNITHVVEASDGNAAMQAIGEQDADILFCDLAMPGMDGVELLRALATHGRRPAVIPISSLDSRLRFGVTRMANELGFQVLGALGKPFERADLVKALNLYVSALGKDDTTSVLTDFTAEDLTDALKARRVELHYQPQARISDGSIIGFETLARIHDGDGRLISPDVFIAMSESSGQIHRLAHLIIDAAIRQLGQWKRVRHDFTLSINLSAINLKRLELPEHVEAIARSHGIDNDQIIIELTESVIQTGAEMYDVMSRFRMKGFGLSIDDFGTGDSSLTRLRSLPFTELKLDQHFVKGCAREPELQSIVNSSIQLAHELGMHVVAEGVETQDEWDYLEAAGCDIAQGFLVSAPLAAAKVPAWLNTWKSRPDRG